jgi:GxxExxY protein
VDRQDAKTPKKEPDPQLDRLAGSVIDAAFEVHEALGPGYGELVYEAALSLELEMRGLRFERQPVSLVKYKGRCVGEGRLDLLVEGLLVVELKAVPALAPLHTAQVLAYLKATGHTLGLLINFNVPVLKQGIRRVVLTQSPGVLASWRSLARRSGIPQ